MPFSHSGSVRYYQFNSFDHPDVRHAVFTRRGGYSPKPWDSLNMGAMLGDDVERVIKNRKLAFQVIGRDPNSIHDLWQIHGAEIICVDSPRTNGKPHIKADGLLTDNPEVTLFLRFADCVPILLYDPIKKVVGLVHAGWQGTVNKIAKEAISSMVNQYGSQPADILAGIGPSISCKNYPIGAEVVDQVHTAFGDESDKVLFIKGTRTHFDLWEANRILLSRAGLHEIEIANICTADNLNDWFSHRGEEGRTGRFGALIGLS
jgi:YfiH family protein